MATRRFPERPLPDDAAQPVTTRLDVPGRTLARIGFAAVLTMAALWLIRSLAHVLVLIVLALLVAVVLSGLVDWLHRRRMSRGLAALISLVVVLLVVGGVLALTVPPLVHELNELFDNLPRTAAGLRQRLSGNPAVYNALAERLESLRSNPARLLTGALHFGFGVASNLFIGVLLLTLALYFLIDGAQLHATLLRFTPAAYRSRVAATLSGAADVIKAYFIGRSMVSAIFAVFTFLLLTVLHVPYATVFAVLSFFLGAIPNIGSTLATVLPALVALAYRGITTALILVVALVLYQQLENNLIQPRVLSKKLNVLPISTMLGVIIGGKLLGIIGVILAVPFVGLLPVLERVWIRPEQDTTQPSPVQ